MFTTVWWWVLVGISWVGCGGGCWWGHGGRVWWWVLAGSRWSDVVVGVGGVSVVVCAGAQWVLVGYRWSGVMGMLVGLGGWVWW